MSLLTEARASLLWIRCLFTPSVGRCCTVLHRVAPCATCCVAITNYDAVQLDEGQRSTNLFSHLEAKIAAAAAVVIRLFCVRIAAIISREHRVLASRLNLDFCSGMKIVKLRKMRIFFFISLTFRVLQSIISMYYYAH